MKKYLSKGLGFLVLGSLLIGATPALAVGENPTTNPVGVVTTTDATLNGTNGSFTADAGTEAFWYGTTDQGVNPFDPNVLPSGWIGGIYADTFNPTQDAPGDMFSKTVTGLTPNTRYYYVAWVSVGSVWYPGAQESFMTAAVVPVIPACDSSTFDSSSVGSVNGQDGWSVTGPYDQAVVDNTYGFTSFGCKSLRISNSVGSGSFGDQTFSPSNSNETGETSAVSGVYSGGTRQNHFEAEFDIASTSPSEQSGLVLSVSPDRGDGARMSYLRFEDRPDGIHVFFVDVTDAGPLPTTASFDETELVTLDRADAHNIKFVVDVFDGPANDVVEIYINGNLEITGTTWEDYYRYDSEQTGNGNQVPTIDSLIFRVRDTASTSGNGFLFDNFETESSIVLIPQTITFDPLTPTTKTYGDADFTVTAIGGASGNPVTFSTTSAACSVTPSVPNTATVHIIKAGSCVIDADQAAGGVYSAAIQTPTTVTVNPVALTVTASTDIKLYDGTNSSVGMPVLTSGALVPGDTVTWTQRFDTKNVGTGKTLTPAGTVNDGNSGANYNVTFVNDTTGVITAIPLTVTSVFNSKVYDGTTSSVAVPAVTGTIASGDTVAFIQTYNTPSIGGGKLLTSSGVVNDGNAGLNYTYTFVPQTFGVVTAKELTISGLSAANKQYDTNTSVVISGLLSLDGVVGFEDVQIVGSPVGTFVDENVGPAKNVAVTGLTLSGTATGNYTLTLPTLTADITTAPLTITAQTHSKIYDGNTSASAVPVVSGLLSGDTATGLVETYDTKDVDTGKTLAVSAYTINDGNSGNNYSVSLVDDTTGVITERALIVSATGIDKVYDGNTTATVTLGDNRVAGDTLTTSYTTASFADKNVGVGKLVSVSGISISGADADNYTFNTTASTTANITARPLAVTANASDKFYDATTGATVIFSDDRVALDDITVSGVANFSDKNVDNNKTVNVTGISISGTDAGNYTHNTTTTDTANITPVALLVSASAQNKQVDGNTTATVTLSNDAFLGDVVTQTYTTADFSDALIGVGKTVTVLGIATAGADAGNYSPYNTTATSTADITEQPSSGSSGGSRARPRTVTGTTGTVLGAEKFNFTLNMKQGSVGNEVMELQKFLNANGFGTLVVDGKVGPMTRAAVVKFQLANGLVGDGVVGPLTRAVLNK